MNEKYIDTLNKMRNLEADMLYNGVFETNPKFRKSRMFRFFVQVVLIKKDHHLWKKILRENFSN